MNIYLVTIPDYKTGYDCYSGHVVIAKTPKEAKFLCSQCRGDEGPRVWIEEGICKKIGVTNTKTSQIVLSDFHAG